MVVIVSPLNRLARIVATRSPSHVISLLSPEEMIDTPVDFAPAQHLRLSVHDIARPRAGLIAPDASMVEQALSFGRGWDAKAPLVIHCFAGISRSTATAFAVLCDRNPRADERTIALAMRRAAPNASPNLRIVDLADEMLGRRGRMLSAVAAMGARKLVAVGEAFELPAQFRSLEQVLYLESKARCLESKARFRSNWILLSGDPASRHPGPAERPQNRREWLA